MPTTVLTAVTATVVVLLVITAVLLYVRSIRQRNAKATLEDEVERLRAELVAQRAIAEAPAGAVSEVAPPAPSPAIELESANAPEANATEWPRVPDVPDELVRACADRRCVLVAGTGLDCQLGLPNWSQTLAELIERASAQGLLSEAGTLRRSLARGDLVTVESILRRRLERGALFNLYREVIKASRSAGSSQAHRALQELPLADVLTSSWDRGLDRTFADRNPLTVTATSPNIQEALSGSRFLLIRLFGDVDRLETAAFGVDEFRHQMEENETYRRLVAMLVQEHTVFFVGISLKGIEEFMKAIRVSRIAESHFALVPRAADSQIQEELFVGSYNTRLLLYAPDDGHTAVPRFLEALRDKVGVRPQVGTPTVLESETISKVVLKNIGPFRDLELKLNGGWNVLLGNNGCGKSTILKAIALGLCGDEPAAARTAEQLLRTGEDTGFVEVELGGSVYRTQLKREPPVTGSVRVVGSQLTPLQRGRWVSLGFPPLRGISERNPTGPSGATRRRPDVDDLLPLLTGTADHRMDTVKQWIVNLDVKSTQGPEVSTEEAERNKKLRDSFFSRLDSLCPGVDFKFDRVRRDSWEVYVKTQDGAGSIPIGQVSQGTTSFLGWVGTLVQRSYEIHDTAEAAEAASAVVLVDEIDAHLHPEWQKALVPLVSNRFPKLQVITTTHSPLVVAGMKAEEVFIVRRDLADRRSIAVAHPPIEFEGLRADQILTSPLFGLASSRSDETERDVDRYSKLLGIPSEERTPIEKQDFERLRERLSSLLAEGQTEAERRVEKAVRQELRRAVDPAVSASNETLDPEVELRLRSRLSEVFSAEESSK